MGIVSLIIMIQILCIKCLIINILFYFEALIKILCLQNELHSISDKADVSQVSITPSMIRSCQSARMRYGIYLAEQAEKNRVSGKDDRK